MPTLATEDTVFDQSLNYIKNNAVKVHACAMGASANSYTNITTNELGSLAITSANFTGPANGPVSGRDMQLNANDIPITVGGTADAIALTDGAANWYVVSTLAATVVVSNGDTLQQQAFDCLQILDSVAA